MKTSAIWRLAEPDQLRKTFIAPLVLRSAPISLSYGYSTFLTLALARGWNLWEVRMPRYVITVEHAIEAAMPQAARAVWAGGG